MVSFLRLIKSDFYKLKHTSFYLMHLLIPLIGIFLFLWYFLFAAFDSSGKVQFYFEALALTFLPLIGIITAMVVETDAMAGNFKEVLGTENHKGKCFLALLSMLLLSGFVSTIIAVGGFYFGFEFILKQNELPFSFYLMSIGILAGSQAAMYVFHLCLCFWFGKEVCIGTGIVEGLIAALMLTGLGNGRWMYLPCCFGSKFLDYLLLYRKQPDYFLTMKADLSLGIINCIAGSVILVMVSAICFTRYEGRWKS